MLAFDGHPAGTSGAPGIKSIRIHLQPQVGPRLWVGAEEEAKSAELIKPVLDDPVTTDREVGGGDVERFAGALAEEVVERIDEAMGKVVDNKGEGHGHPRLFFLLDVFLTQACIRLDHSRALELSSSTTQRRS